MLRFFSSLLGCVTSSQPSNARHSSRASDPLQHPSVIARCFGILIVRYCFDGLAEERPGLGSIARRVAVE